MTQFAVLTETWVREALEEQKGELVVEHAPPEQGDGWIITMEVDGVRCVVITEKHLNLRVFKEVGSAVSFIQRINPDQEKVEVLLRDATDVPSMRLNPRPKTKTSKTTKSVRKSKPKRT